MPTPAETPAAGIAITGSRTRRWPAYEVTCGILLPAVVLTLDLEWDGPLGGGIEYLPLRPYSSLAAYASMAALAAWLPFRHLPGRWQAAAAGVFAEATAMAGAIGVFLLPLSVVGTLFAGIGLLGFVPLLTAHVFLRAARTAWEADPSRPMAAAGRATAAALLLGGAGLLAGWGVSRAEIACTRIVSGDAPGDAARAEAALRGLRRFPGISLHALRWRALDRQAPEPVRSRAREAYLRIAGRAPEDWD